MQAPRPASPKKTIMPSRKVAPSSSTSSSEEEEWCSDLKFDFNSREAYKVLIRSPGPYTVDEDKSFELGLLMEAKVTSGGAAQITAIKTKHSLIDASTASVNDVLHGHLSCLIRASTVDVLSFIMDNDSNISAKYERGYSTIERRTLEVKNNHCSAFYLSVKCPSPFHPREFVANNMWRKEGENNYLYVTVPADHVGAPPSHDLVRGETVRTTRLTEVSPGVTRYTTTFTLDLRGNFPNWITNRIAIPANLDAPVRQQIYFLQIKPAEDFDDKGDDATMIAQLMLDAVFSHVSTAYRKDVLRQYCIRAAFFRSISATHPWFQTLLWDIIQNEQQQSLVPRSTSLGAFTAADAVLVGKSFAPCVQSSETPTDAFNRWLAAYPAMAQLADEIALLRPVVECIARRLMQRAGRRDHDWVEHADADKANQADIIHEIRSDPGVYTKKEEEILATGNNMFALFDHKSLGKMKMKTVKTGTRLLSASSFADTNKGLVFGQVSGIVRASPEDIIAFSVDTESNFNKFHNPSKTILKACTVQKVNTRHCIVYALTKMPPPFKNRELLGSFVWKKLGENEYLTVSHPTEHPAVPKTPDVVRAELLRAVRLVEISPGVTKYEMVISFDFKGNMPFFFVENEILPQALLQTPAVHQLYSLQTKGIDAYDKAGEDAQMLGNLFMDAFAKAKKKGTEEEEKYATENFFTRAEALREMNARYPWIRPMVLKIATGRTRFAKFETVVENDTPLHRFTSDDADFACKSFAKYIVGNSQDAAISEWFASVAALRASWPKRCLCSAPS